MTTLDFLHAALDRSAYAAFFTESRTRLLDSTKLHRKSGFVLGYSQPSLRDWVCQWRSHTDTLQKPEFFRKLQSRRLILKLYTTKGSSFERHLRLAG
jgi:hypothetical protein